MRLCDRLWVSVTEYETATGLSRSTIHRLIQRGEIRSKKLGGRRLIAATELLPPTAAGDPKRDR